MYTEPIEAERELWGRPSVRAPSSVCAEATGGKDRELKAGMSTGEQEPSSRPLRAYRGRASDVESHAPGFCKETKTSGSRPRASSPRELQVLASSFALQHLRS